MVIYQLKLIQKSFDTLATVDEAHKVIQLYRNNNVDTDRI